MVRMTFADIRIKWLPWRLEDTVWPSWIDVSDQLLRQYERYPSPCVSYGDGILAFDVEDGRAAYRYDHHWGRAPMTRLRLISGELW